MSNYSNDEMLKHFRYIVTLNDNRAETIGAYNDLGLAVDQLWRWFKEFPGKYVIVDTKDDTKFFITVTI
jgi:uncharacterized protein YehS (DUF1456 family)